MENELVIELLYIQSPPNQNREENNLDLTHLMIDKKFDQLGLTETGRNWTSIPDNEKIPHRFCGHFMTQKLD